jgi:hypothetical protein
MYHTQGKAKNTVNGCSSFTKSSGSIHYRPRPVNCKYNNKNNRNSKMAHTKLSRRRRFNSTALSDPSLRWLEVIVSALDFGHPFHLTQGVVNTTGHEIFITI